MILSMFYSSLLQRLLVLDSVERPTVEVLREGLRKIVPGIIVSEVVSLVTLVPVVSQNQSHYIHTITLLNEAVNIDWSQGPQHHDRQQYQPHQPQ